MNFLSVFPGSLFILQVLFFKCKCGNVIFFFLSLVGIPARSSAFAAVGYGVSVHLVQHKHGKED